METSDLRRHLDAEYARFRALIPAGTDLTTVRVPSCPEWSLDDLVQHLGEVYLHKVDCIRLNARPTEEPDLTGLTSVQVLERGFAELSTIFDEHSPKDPAWTWFAPDQTVGFWIRRMAHETAVHRFDAELAVHSPTEIGTELAEDGLDEVLATMLVADIEPWEYEIGRPDIEVRAPGRSWFVHFEKEALRVSDAGEAATVILGDPSDLELWLYNRITGDHLTFTGDLVGMGVLKDLMTEATK